MLDAGDKNSEKIKKLQRFYLSSFAFKVSSVRMDHKVI